MAMIIVLGSSIFNAFLSFDICVHIGYGIFGEGSKILTNQKREVRLLASDRLKFRTVLQTYRALYLDNNIPLF